MSLKNRTIEAVRGAVTGYIATANNIKKIMENPDGKLSAAGIQAEVNAERDSFIAKIDADTAEYYALMMEAAAAKEKSEARVMAARINQPAYQQALTMALQQIPYAVNNVSSLQLRERLAMFENDSFAAPMIEKALKDAGAGILDIGAVMPKNKNGMAKEIMLAVADWTKYYMLRAKEALQDLQRSPDMRLDESYGYMVDSYISYLAGLSNDADCFKPQDYTPAEGEQIHPAAAFKMASLDVLGEIVRKYEHPSLDEGNSDGDEAGTNTEGAGSGAEGAGAGSGSEA